MRNSQKGENAMKHCNLCPRRCNAVREKQSYGYCRSPWEITAARAALHMWEEPVLSGTNGSGTVFFSGCNLGCVFCQNQTIAAGETAMVISNEKLTDLFLMLQEKGAHNINLVTGSHYVPQIVKALERARNDNLTIPVVYNTGSYEKVQVLKLLDGLVDIYLPDMKYRSSTRSARYANAPDYFEVAAKALEEMVRQVGDPIVEDGLMKKGVIVRHLMLPGGMIDSKAILRYLHKTWGNHIYISIMNQYTPCNELPDYPELQRKLTEREYEKLIDYAVELGIEQGFVQEGETAEESFIPAFDYEGIR